MKVVEMSLGKVSVVIMARAVESQDWCVEEREEQAFGIPERIFAIGRR